MTSKPSISERTSAPPSGPYLYRAEMLSNYDGDTIRCDIDLGMKSWLKDKQVRLFGIDTPEIRTSSDIERRLGEAASELVRFYLPERQGFLLETMKDETGKYGRLLGRLHVQTNGQFVCINDRLVEKKLAQPYFGAKRSPWTDWYLANRSVLSRYTERPSQ